VGGAVGVTVMSKSVQDWAPGVCGRAGAHMCRGGGGGEGGSGNEGDSGRGRGSRRIRPEKRQSQCAMHRNNALLILLLTFPAPPPTSASSSTSWTMPFSAAAHDDGGDCPPHTANAAVCSAAHACSSFGRSLDVTSGGTTIATWVDATFVCLFAAWTESKWAARGGSCGACDTASSDIAWRYEGDRTELLSSAAAAECELAECGVVELTLASAVVEGARGFGVLSSGAASPTSLPSPPSSSSASASEAMRGAARATAS
jgi:hypothetical protein